MALADGRWKREAARQVPMQMLRPALIPGTAVMARVEEKWIPAHVLGVNPSSGTCQVDLDDDSESWFRVLRVISE